MRPQRTVGAGAAGAKQSASIDAAALQAEMARRFKLPGSAMVVYSAGGSKASAHNRPRPRPTGAAGSSGASRAAAAAPAATVRCACCGEANDASSSICSTCGYFLRSADFPVQSTLAELRGLVKAAPKVEALPQSDWDHIEGQLEGRKDAFCPICMCAFSEGREVLLSCSHMFHQACLSAFEKFMKSDERCCPICRTSRYQKKITRQGSKAYAVLCVVKLQACIRGHLARRRYYRSRKTYYQSGRGDRRLRERFYHREMASITDKMSKDVDERKGELDCVISSAEETLHESRQLDLLFDGMLREREARMALQAQQVSASSSAVSAAAAASSSVAARLPVGERDDDDDYRHIPLPDPAPRAAGPAAAPVHWQSVLQRAAMRGLGECAICMGSNLASHSPGKKLPVAAWGNGGNGGAAGRKLVAPQRPLVLLSCSHVFHAQCVENFERFRVDDAVSCPVCRASGYAKRPLSQDDVRIVEGMGDDDDAAAMASVGGMRTPRVGEPKGRR